MEFLVAAAVVGSLLSAKSQMDAADAQAGAAKAQARAKREQAVELLKRARINAERTREQGATLVKGQQASFAAGGVSITSGSTLAVMNDTINKVERNIEDQLQEANFKASMLQKGADVDTSLAGDIRKAGTIGAIGSLISGGVSAYNVGK